MQKTRVVRLECIALVFLATLSGLAQDGDFKGKIVIAGTGPQLETSIDIITARSISGMSRTRL